MTTRHDHADGVGGEPRCPPTGPLSLAAGVLPEFEPPGVVSAAAAAGFEMVGIWFDPDTWSRTRAREVRWRLDGSGVAALDMEPIFVTPDGDCGFELIDAAAAVGARNVLTVSRGLEPARFADRFAELCDRAAPAGITVVVEPTVLYSVSTLAEAQQVVALAARPNGAILADNLHLDRADGEPLTALRQLDPALLPYAQLCDAPAKPADTTRPGLFDDARDRRKLLGEGDLPVREFVASLPAGIPLSLEIRSQQLRERYPDATKRAARVRTSAARFLESSTTE
ncbi:MAG: TIM barrel protein [bacterium]|nr:TIM barrel protein [bacterium]